MKSDTRREALILLSEVWELSPDVRLGQLFAHLGFLGEAHLGHGLGDIDDEEMMAILNLHKSEFERRLRGATEPTASEVTGGVSITDSPAITPSVPGAAVQR